jgi:hypothetical protein
MTDKPVVQLQPRVLLSQLRNICKENLELNVEHTKYTSDLQIRELKSRIHNVTRDETRDKLII